MHRAVVRGTLVCLFAVALAGCATTYYSAMEGLGYHKRDILVDRIEDARDEQEEAIEQFQTALERFSEVVGFQGGSLQDQYDKLNKEFKRSEAEAKDVRKSIDDVEDVARALFREWESELDQYTSESLRRESERKLRETQTRYLQLIGAMQRAESKIEPVLGRFRDQVLFIKHNLNAQAIASLENELDSIETDVARLIAEMEASIAEADGFIREMSSQS